jgi:hemerythrin-like domain-containing protein
LSNVEEVIVMSSEWTTYQSFQQGQELLDAVNTLSIHLKLGEEELGDEESLEKARERIESFLNDLQEHIAQDEEGEGLILGTGPRLRQFAHRFAEAQHEPRQFQSPLMSGELDRVRRLLQKDSFTEKESRELVSSLDEFKVLLEEHVDTDANRLFGEI